LKEKGANCIIASGMDTCTQELLNGAKINPILGVEEKVQDAIDNLLAGTLEEVGKLFVQQAQARVTV